MKPMNKPKLPKLDKETAGKAGGLLVAAGTIIKAGVEIAKIVGKSKTK